ncbi:MAG: hypothetical protein ABEJ76_05940 [Halanaeroarchaeum sp.]
MSRHSSSSRRQFLRATSGAALIALSGCSQTESVQTPDRSPDQDANAAGGATTVAGATSTGTDATESATSCEAPANGEITTLAEYECVTANQETWLGREVSSTGRVGSRYREAYVVFKHQLKSEGDLVLPFFVKTAREFSTGTTYAFTGTIAKFADVQDRPVIYLENPTFEKKSQL